MPLTSPLVPQTNRSDLQQSDELSMPSDTLTVPMLVNRASPPTHFFTATAMGWIQRSPTSSSVRCLPSRPLLVSPSVCRVSSVSASPAEDDLVDDSMANISLLRDTRSSTESHNILYPDSIFSSRNIRYPDSIFSSCNIRYPDSIFSSPNIGS